MVLGPLADEEEAPARGILTLGLLRLAEGNSDAAASLLERATRLAPEDRWVLYWAADGVPSRARSVELLEGYLARSQGDDPDRIESARSALVFQRALGDRKVWVPVERPARLELRLMPYGTGGVVRGRVIQADLGGRKPIRFLLDTGSTGVFLVERIARKLGFAPLATETRFGGGGDERHRTRRGILPSFGIGGLRYGNALVTVSADEVEPTGQYQGILGIQVFDGYRITIDPAQGRLVLDGPVGDRAGEPYWTVAGQLLVEASAVGAPNGLFLFDTGAARSLVSSGYVTAIPGAALGRAAEIRGYGGAVRGAREARGVRVEFQSLRTPDAPIPAVDLSLRSRMGGVEVAGYLGLDLLSEARITIDTRARRVVVDGPTAGRDGGRNPR